MPTRRTLTKPQRREYVAAVQCLQNKPSILPAGTSAGSKSLFDDFVYVHLQSTVFIHFTVSWPAQLPGRERGRLTFWAVT